MADSSAAKSTTSSTPTSNSSDPQKVATTDCDKKRISKSQRVLLREYIKELRDLATHEGEITNHRIQWFALLNGLLFATFGLLWEFRDTSIWVLIVVAGVGILTSISCSASLLLGGWACKALSDKKKAVLKGINEDAISEHLIPPIMGYEPALGWWNLIMPWTVLGPLFTVAWIVVLGVAVCNCDVAYQNKPDDALSKTVDSLSKTVDSLSKTVDSLSKTSDSLSKTSDSLNKTVDSLNKTSDSLNKTSDSLNKTSDSLNKTSDSLGNAAATP